MEIKRERKGGRRIGKGEEKKGERGGEKKEQSRGNRTQWKRTLLL